MSHDLFCLFYLTVYDNFKGVYVITLDDEMPKRSGCSSTLGPHVNLLTLCMLYNPLDNYRLKVIAKMAWKS